MERVVGRMKGVLDSGDRLDFKKLLRHLPLDSTLFHHYKSDPGVAMMLNPAVYLRGSLSQKEI